MIDIIIIIALIAGIIIGLKRGFIMAVVHLVGTLVSFFIAATYYAELAPHLVLWIPFPSIIDNEQLQLFFNVDDLDSVFYRGIAFIIIFVGAKLVLQLVSTVLDSIASLPLLAQVNRLLGGAFGFVEAYLLLFLLLYISALLPLAQVQQPIQDSVLAEMIVDYTPLFSEKIKQLWFDETIKL